MTWPTVAVNTTNCDSTGDSPSLFRSDVLDAIQKLNAIIASPPFAAGVRLAFPQAAAPSGWTQDTTDAATDRMLRVVNTTGGGTGGTITHSPILMNVVPSHTHTYSGNTGAMSANASHGHTDSGHQHNMHNVANIGGGGSAPNMLGGGSAGILTDAASAVISNTNTDHTHAISGTVAANGSAANWAPRYIDLIICSKD